MVFDVGILRVQDLILEIFFDVLAHSSLLPADAVFVFLDFGFDSLFFGFACGVFFGQTLPLGNVPFVLIHRVFEVLVNLQKKLVGFFDVGLGLGFDNRLLDGFFVHFHLPLFDVGLGFDRLPDYQIIVAVL